MPFNRPTRPAADTRKLIWTLDGITNCEEAVQFVMLFENTFPVFHPYMQQIYFRYRFVVQEENKQLIVEPDWDLHERLAYVSENAFTDRRIHILPGDVIGREGIYTRAPKTKKRRASRSVTSKLGTTIKALHYESRLQGEQVIPVFSRQAIREYHDGMPNMELSFYDLRCNDRLSPFVRETILNTVFDRILALEIG